VKERMLEEIERKIDEGMETNVDEVREVMFHVNRKYKEEGENRPGKRQGTGGVIVKALGRQDIRDMAIVNKLKMEVLRHKDVELHNEMFNVVSGWYNNYDSFIGDVLNNYNKARYGGVTHDELQRRKELHQRGVRVRLGRCDDARSVSPYDCGKDDCPFFHYEGEATKGKGKGK
jgi:hypothetical protein